MSVILDTLNAVLPTKRKLTSGGWISFSAPCCPHRGEGVDKKMRGGIIFTDTGFRYHCFNCGFKAGWTPGHTLTQNTRNLFSWLGVTDSVIHSLVFESLRHKNDVQISAKVSNFVLKPKDLPPDCKTIDQHMVDGCENPIFVSCIAYILDRGMKLEWFPWMWSPAAGFADRIIIPYYHNGVIVGYTARKITNGSPKYITSSQPSYVFNLDNQAQDRQFVIVVEGPIDAISIDGVAAMSNELNEEQIFRINSLAREVIVVPDRDVAGTKLIDIAIAQQWSVSSPLWENGVKDVAEAVSRYGRIYTLFSILKYREHGEIRLTMIKKRIERNAEK
jgi:hypothetical protein